MGVVAMMMAQGAASSGPVAVTWNPSDKSANITLSSGNLVATKTAGGEANNASLRATQGRDAADAGGFYFEVVVTTATTSPFIVVGVANSSQVLTSYIGNSTNGWSYYEQTGDKYTGGSGSAYGSSYTTGDVIGVLLKNGKLYFRKNGTWQNSADPDAETGAAFTGLTGTLYPAASLYRASSPSHVITGRFKASAFSGSIPTGAAAWES